MMQRMKNLTMRFLHVCLLRLPGINDSGPAGTLQENDNFQIQQPTKLTPNAIGNDKIELSSIIFIDEEWIKVVTENFWKSNKDSNLSTNRIKN